jgi:hypothetical protein
VLGEGLRNVNNDFTRGKALCQYPVVVDVPCGVREKSFAEVGGNLVQTLAFEQGRDVEDGNIINGVSRILREATRRKFVIDWLKGNRLGGKTIHDVGIMMGRPGMVFHREGQFG